MTVVNLPARGEPDPDGRDLTLDADDGELRPLLPDWLASFEDLRSEVRRHAGRQSHAAAYHGLRAPQYVMLTLGWAVLGAGKLTARLVRWANWTDGWFLESQAVAAGRGGHNDALNTHKEGKKTRGIRWKAIAAGLAASAVGVLVGIRFLPWYGWIAAGVTGLLVLAYHGKPKGRALIQPAVVPPRYAPPTPQIITRAFGSLGISGINQVLSESRDLSYVTDVHRDGEGWSVDLDLPHGVTARMIVARRDRLAAGLRRPLSATWPTPVPHEHEARLRLWIGYTDMSKVKPKPWPLLKSGQADIFQHAPFATNPRGINVGVPVFEANHLIGAAPGEGKTAAVRALGCYAALDPLCDLWVHEQAGKGDLEAFAQVSHRYVSGLDDEAVQYAAESFALLRKDLERRSAALKKVPREQRPHGKLTRELAMRDRRLRPVVAIFDEVQNVFQHPEFGKQAAEDAAHVIRLGRAYGIIIILATQRPDKDSLPTAVSGVVTVRFCLKVPDQVSNDMILGTGAYKAGFNSVVFRHEIDAGLGWLRGAADPEAVKTYYLSLEDTAKVIARARAMRVHAGVLTGHAAGEGDDASPRRFLEDVAAVFGPREDKLWSETIAARLAGQLPDVYADINQAAVGDQLRALGVTVKQVREPGAGPRAGCERSAVEEAMQAMMAGG